MPERKDMDYIRDIQEAISRISLYTEGMNYNSFSRDTKTQDAVIRNLEIIGEAARNISIDLRTGFTDIPWKSMIGIRDRLIHHYFGVNLNIVWQVCINELPRVRKALEILQDKKNEE